MKKEQTVKEFWESTSTTFAHLTIDRWLGSVEELQKDYENKFLSKLGEIKDKVVVDYGIGGGWLGELLLRKYDIKTYIGIDIAERSIEEAKKNLNEFNNKELYTTPVDFSTLEADVFISVATIQHFIDLEYLKDFLKNLNSSGISELVLQIRHGTKNIFNCKDEYTDAHKIRTACFTNISFIDSCLSNYYVKDNSHIYGNKKYQFVFLVKK